MPRFTAYNIKTRKGHFSSVQKPMRQLVYSDHKKLMKLTRNVGAPDWKFLANNQLYGAQGAGVILNGAPVMFAFADIPQGVTANTRVGNEVTIKRLEIRFNMYYWTLQPIVAPYDLNVNCRVTLLCHTKISPAQSAAGTAAVPNDVLDTTANSTISSMDFENIFRSKEFRVMKSRHFSLSYGGPSGKTIKWVMKKPLVQKYIDNVQTHHSANRLYLLVESDAQYPISGIAYDGYNRVEWTD